MDHHTPVTASSTGDGWVSREADRLVEAQRGGVGLRVLSARRPGLSLIDAYRVQAQTIAHRQREGARVIGHKVGLTSEAMQRQTGIGEPDSGVLLDTMVVPDGGQVPLGALHDPRVEAEIAFRLGSDLHGPDLDARQVHAAVSEVLLALEILDTRYTTWQITVADSIADNASCGRVVPGPAVPLDPTWDLRREHLILTLDDEVAGEGDGSAVLGDPVNPLIWLARRLHGMGGGLRAGDLVLAGSVLASAPLRPGTDVRVTSTRLPPAGFRVT